MADENSLVIDEYGRPFSKNYIAKLREQTAPIDAALGRPPFQGHLAIGIDPQALGGIIRAADGGSSMEWQILAEEIEELYPHYFAVLSKRRRQVCQLPITVVPAGGDAASKKHAEMVTDWLDTDVLAAALFNMTDAIGKGFSIHEIMWDTQPDRVRPAHFEYLPQRFFEVSWQDGQTIWLRDGAGYTDLAPHKFLRHRHPSKSGNVLRGGLTRVVAFLWMFSAYTLRDWALFCQAYGLPIRVGRYGPEASDNDKRVLWRAVSSIAGDVAAIIPKSMELEFIKDSERTAGSTLYEKRADWLNREVSKVVLGGTAGTEAIHGGHAVGQEHRAAEQDVERFDAFLMSTTLTRQVVQPMVAFTFGPQAKYPKLKIGQADEVPLAQVIAGVADLAGVGLKVKASEMRSRLGLTEPEAGEETIGGVPPAPEPAPTIPRPAVAPPVAAQGQRRPFLGQLLTLQAEAPPELVEAMTQRLAEDAAGALAGMTDAIREQFELAEDMPDLSHRLQTLQLPQAQFAEAMTRGAALANLVGQASVVSEMLARARR